MLPHAEARSILSRCSHCGQPNRVPAERVVDDPICGRCKRRLFPHRPVTVTEATWPDEVDNCPIPVLADFWAAWCAPCRTVAPVLEHVAIQRGGRLKVVKVNIDDNPALAARFAVRSIPTLVVLRGGQEIDRIVGALPTAELDRRLARIV
jgi:thioredoxin 2